MEKCYKIPSDTSILLYSVCMPVILIFPVFPDLQARFALCTRQHTVMKRLTLQAQFFLHILHHIEVKNNQKHGGNHPCKRTCHARHGVALFIRCNNSHHASSYKLSHTGKHRQKARSPFPGSRCGSSLPHTAEPGTFPRTGGRYPP